MPDDTTLSTSTIEGELNYIANRVAFLNGAGHTAEAQWEADRGERLQALLVARGRP